MCLFDDHGVDGLQTVSMIQWVSNPRLLIVHGTSECENEESYLTYIAVPKLGCRECSEIRKSESDENCKTDTLCIRCNMTIHSKYTRTDSDPELLPAVNFNHPDYLVMVSNGFIHALNIKLEKPPQQRLMPKTSYAYQQLMYPNVSYAPHSSSQEQTMNEIELNFGTVTAMTKDNNNLSGKQKHPMISNNVMAEPESDVAEPSTSSSGQQQRRVVNVKKKTESATTLVDRIIADFAECETIRAKEDNRGKKTPETAGRQFFSTSTVSQASQQQQQQMRPKVDSYEFCEETEERCEKISLFRKKRLADKKYEFSEDNSENIIPFNRIRTRSTGLLSGSGGGGGVIPGSGPSGYFEMTPYHAHRGSPSHGFRSPCGSPIGNRCLRSPGGYYPSLSPSSSSASNSGMFSPKHQFYFKRSLPPHIFSSPKRNAGDQLQEILPGNYQNTATPPLMLPPPQATESSIHSPVAGTNAVDSEKPVFSKKVVRRYVEETDAASVITNEEGE